MSKRRATGWGIGVALTAAIVACGFVQWHVSASLIASSLNSAVGDSRLRWAPPSAATFRVLPWPSLRIFDARLDDPSGVNVAAAPEARLDLSLAGLAQGRFVPVNAVLVNPIATVDLGTPSMGPQSAFDVLRARRELAALSSLRVVNGVLRLIDKSRGLDTIIESVQGRLDGLGAGGRLRGNLSGVWRDTPLQASGSLGDLEAIARGEPTSLALALTSPVATLAFKGELTGGASLSLTGDFSASVRSIGALARLIRVRPPALLVSDDAAIVGKAKATPESITFDKATLTSGGQIFKGALQASHVGGRLAVSGTLDAERLALAPLFGPPTHVFDANGEWSEAHFGLDLPRDFDLDLRLSAGLLDVYGRRLNNAAASVMLKDGALTLNLLEVTSASGGSFEGEIRLACVGNDLEIAAKAKIVDADLSVDFADLGWPIPKGRATADFTLAASGAAPAAAIARSTGSGSVNWKQGAIGGVNLEEALRRSRNRSIDVGRDIRFGETAFDRLSFEFVIEAGTARILRGELSARGVAANVQGAIDLGTRSLNLRMNATQTDSAGAESQDAARLSLDIEGPWSSPRVRTAAAAESPLPENDPAP